MADYEFEATPALVNNVVSWTLCYKGTNPPDCNSATKGYPNVDVPVNKADQTFSYKIVNDNTGLGIVFSPDPVPNPPPRYDGPLWIKSGQKPTAPIISGQIYNVGGAGTTELTFTDKNSSSAVLKYQLNFVDRGMNKVTAIDPDIKNGGHNFFYVSNPIPLVIAAAVALVLLAAWWKKVESLKVRRAGTSGAERHHG